MGFACFIGLIFPVPFWLLYKFSPSGSRLQRAAHFIHTPIVALYVGYLPYSVNGQWWSCLVIGLASQWWARTHRPKWFRKYNYLTSAALDGGSQIILFILSFAVFGASGNAVDFPYWFVQFQLSFIDETLTDCSTTGGVTLIPPWFPSTIARRPD